MDDTPKVLILAGPNGAGKTTFATEYLQAEADCPRFVNADSIASGLNPFNPAASEFRAGRLMLATIKELTEKRESFAFETTLSGRLYIKRIQSWCAAGYRVNLHYLYLRSSSLAINRVLARVRAGGHYIPDDVVRRRYDKGWQYFEQQYQGLVDEWTVYDTSESLPLILASGHKGSNSTRESDITEESRKRKLESSLAAMHRAANVAHRRAAERGDKIAIWRDGKVVWIEPIVDP